MFHVLRFRIPAVIIGLGLVSASAIGFIGWSGAEKSAAGAIGDKLSLAAESQRTSLELIAERLRVDIQNVATHKQVLDNILDLSETLLSAPEKKTKVLEHFASVAEGERKSLDGASSGLMYGLRHSKVHPVALSIIDLGHYEDIALLDANGTVVYTAKKGGDFAKQLSELSGTGIEAIFEIMKGRGDKDISFRDFAPTTLGSAPSAYVGIPLLKKSNVAMDRAQEDVRVGYAVIRITPALIDRVMSARYGMGETGQTFAVGPDNIIRTNAPLSKEPTAGKPASNFGIDPSKANLAGGLDDASHKRAAAKVEFMGSPWTIVAELDTAEAMAGADELRRTMGYAGLLILLGQFVVGFLVARGIVRPINTLTSALKIMAGGELSTEIAGKDRRDEIGEIARAVEGIRGSIEADAARRVEAQEEARRTQEQERRRMTADLAREFESHVGTVVRAVASAANDLERSAQEMATTAASSKASSGQVSNATEAANREVQSVAAASEELSASIRDVANLTNRSGAIAADADTHARETHEIVQSLSTKAEHIRSVVDMIKAIAEQTNLLALNATIEAARAGEAGKGFAVVASEVKALASQTAKATEEIASQIHSVSEEVNRAVDAVASIRGVVTSIGEAVVSINGAIEQQTAATQEIAKSASSAADETSTVASSIGTVSQAISTTDQAANHVVAQARKLGTQSGELSDTLQKFISKLLAA